MSDSKKMTFKNVFRATDLMLHINGSHPSFPRGRSWALRGFLTLLVNTAILYFLMNSIISHRVPEEEYTDAVRESIIAILAFTLICQYIILVVNRNVLLKLLLYINEDFEKSVDYTEEEKKILTKYIKKGTNVINLWLLTTFASGLVFIMKGIVPTIYYHCKGKDLYVPIFDAILPGKFDKHQHYLLGYCLISSLWCLFAIIAFVVYNGFAPLVPIFLVHCCGQIEILSLRIKNIFEEYTDYELVFFKTKEINAKLESIYRFVIDVQTTFVPLFEFTMKTTTIVLPFTAFEIVQALTRHEIKLEFLSLFCSALLQFYLPCYYSNLLLDETENMRQAIYSCGWEKVPNVRMRKMLLFMLTRTSKPVVLNTFFYPLCLETFAEMCRQSYAIYNIMVAAWT